LQLTVLLLLRAVAPLGVWWGAPPAGMSCRAISTFLLGALPCQLPAPLQLCARVSCHGLVRGYRQIWGPPARDTACVSVGLGPPLRSILLLVS
jgi:hypothetical protein